MWPHSHPAGKDPDNFAPCCWDTYPPGFTVAMNTNPFAVLEAKLDALAVDVRTLKSRTKEAPSDEIGGLELAEAVTGLSRSTLYKKTHRREIPHRHVGGRLYFRRSELEAWLDQGRRPLAEEIAHERMEGNK